MKKWILILFLIVPFASCGAKFGNLTVEKKIICEGGGCGKIVKHVVLFDKNTNHSLSNGAFDWKAELPIEGDITGLDINDIKAQITGAVGLTNTLDIRLRSCPAVATGRICTPGTGDFDLLSTVLTVDSNEDDSGTATIFVIPASADTVTQGEMIVFFVDAVHSTVGQGLIVTVEFK